MNQQKDLAAQKDRYEAISEMESQIMNDSTGGIFDHSIVVQNLTEEDSQALMIASKLLNTSELSRRRTQGGNTSNGAMRSLISGNQDVQISIAEDP